MSDLRAIIDESYEPLIVTVMPARFTDAEITAFLARHEALLARGRRYCTITDLSQIAGLPEATTRRRIADWQQKVESTMRKWTVGTAIVAPSNLLRGAMTALNWLSPPPYPQEIVADRAAAITALEGIYARAKEPVPASLERYRRDLGARKIAI